jgi:hypothetical protein
MVTFWLRLISDQHVSVDHRQPPFLINYGVVLGRATTVVAIVFFKSIMLPTSTAAGFSIPDPTLIAKGGAYHYASRRHIRVMFFFWNTSFRS